MPRITPRVLFLSFATAALVCWYLLAPQARRADSTPGSAAKTAPASPGAGLSTGKAVGESDLQPGGLSRFARTYTRFHTEMRIDRVPILSQAPTRSTATIDRDVPAVMTDFARWLGQLSEAAPSAREELLVEGRALLEKRMALWADWAKTDPEAALLLSPSPSQRSLLPPDMVANLEEIVSGVGFYGVRVACFHEPNSPHESRCEVGYDVILDSRTFTASIYGSRRERLSEEDASIYGVAKGSVLALHSDDVVLRPLDPRQNYPLDLIYRGEVHRVADDIGLEATLAKIFTP
jgi:hypothetical protein